MRREERVYLIEYRGIWLQQTRQAGDTHLPVALLQLLKKVLVSRHLSAADSPDKSGIQDDRQNPRDGEMPGVARMRGKVV